MFEQWWIMAPPRSSLLATRIQLYLFPPLWFLSSIHPVCAWAASDMRYLINKLARTAQDMP